jgi:hypothetical protein
MRQLRTYKSVIKSNPLKLPLAVRPVNFRATDFTLELSHQLVHRRSGANRIVDHQHVLKRLLVCHGKTIIGIFDPLIICFEESNSSVSSLTVHFRLLENSSMIRSETVNLLFAINSQIHIDHISTILLKIRNRPGEQ